MQELNQDPGEDLIVRTYLNNAMRMGTEDEFGEDSMMELENQILSNYEVGGVFDPNVVRYENQTDEETNADLRMMEERL